MPTCCWISSFHGQPKKSIAIPGANFLWPMRNAFRSSKLSLTTSHWGKRKHRQAKVAQFETTRSIVRWATRRQSRVTPRCPTPPLQFHTRHSKGLQRRESRHPHRGGSGSSGGSRLLLSNYCRDSKVSCGAIPSWEWCASRLRDKTHTHTHKPVVSTVAFDHIELHIFRPSRRNQLLLVSGGIRTWLEYSSTLSSSIWKLVCTFYSSDLQRKVKSIVVEISLIRWKKKKKRTAAI